MSYLTAIIEHKKTEITEFRSSKRLEECRARAADAPPCRGFRVALERPGGPHIIAELKKASPSKGLIRPDYDPAAIARCYEQNGASAISCLTDRRFFQGSIEDLERARRIATIPILRKDFILDECQIFEARAAGADAFLLIAAALSDSQLEDLSLGGARLGLDVLIEVHDREELDRVLGLPAQPRLIGINNRNLMDFRVDLATTEQLAPRIPRNIVVVGESGISVRGDVERLGRAGVQAVLVGETLMRHPDPGQALRSLLAASSPPAATFPISPAASSLSQASSQSPEASIFSRGGRVRIKVCGLTRESDARAALEAGADFLGLVFYPKSPRYLAPERAEALLAAMRNELPGRVHPIGVFVRAPLDEVQSLVRRLGLAAAQLHGDENLEYMRSLQGIPVIRAARVRTSESLDGLESYLDAAAAFLFDGYADSAPGGAGRGFVHDLALPWIDRHPIFIAGGLAPENVGEVVRRLRPFGVDVSSGVEDSPGIKNPERIREFVRAVRRAESDSEAAPPPSVSR